METSNPHQIQYAVAAVKNDNLSIRNSAYKYGVKKSTVWDRLKNDRSNFKGPSSILGYDDEEVLANWIMNCAKTGFPRTRIQIFNAVKSYLDSNNKSSPFKDNRPGHTWFRAFLRRHPSLSVRNAESVSKASANVSESDIRGWFCQIEEYLRINGFLDILSNPTRIYNCDETFLAFNSSSKVVIGLKGNRTCYSVNRAAEKSGLTALCTFSAAGQSVKPYILLPYKRTPARVLESFADYANEIACEKSESGWMTAETFLTFLSTVFLPTLTESGVEFPVALFVDNHSSHLSLKTSDFCWENKIILIGLYPNSTHILQPCDVGIYAPVKSYWKQELQDWSLNHVNQTFSTAEFCPVMKKTLDRVLSNEETIPNSFRVCGLYPWCPENVDYTKCISKKETLTTRIDLVENSTNSLDANETLTSLIDLVENSTNSLDANETLTTRIDLVENSTNSLDANETLTSRIDLVENSTNSLDANELFMQIELEHDYSCFQRTMAECPVDSGHCPPVKSITKQNFHEIFPPLNYSQKSAFELIEQIDDYLNDKDGEPSQTGKRQPLATLLLNQTPKAPQREGKRNITRTSPVISSLEYSDFKRKKLKDAENKKIQTEERKLLRIQKKLEKETVKQKKFNQAKFENLLKKQTAEEFSREINRIKNPQPSYDSIT